VSAIIPTYNREHIVCEAVESILRQTYPKIEVIVVDDGSTDGTLSALEQYGDRIRIITQNNSGPSAARNRGIEASNGEIVAFLDSDDLWLPTKIERQVALLVKADRSVPCCLCNIAMQWVDKKLTSFQIAQLSSAIEEGVWLNPDEVLATRFVLTNQGIAIRHEVLDRIGGFDEGLRLLEDYELSLRLSLEGPWAFIREPLVTWRQTTSGSLYQNAQKDEIHWRSSILAILENHLAAVQLEHRDTTSVRHLAREVRRASRSLKAVKLSGTGSWNSFVMGCLLQRYERYRSALFRRMPWFPKMRIAPADS
jgi:glycosyltransferase involved in cell wall biosynthesis